jgi:hypothetical protein
MLKNQMLIRHLGWIHHFWLVLYFITSIHVAGKNFDSLLKKECKNIFKLQCSAVLNFGCHFGLQTPSLIRQDNLLLNIPD